MIYVIDTDSLIALPRLYSHIYFETLWDDINKAIKRGTLILTKFNLSELKEKEEDEYFENWKKEHTEMFLEIDDITQETVTDILSKYPDLIDQTSEKEQADPFLIALAISKNGCIVTEEVPLDKASIANPKRKKKMKIPNVCIDYNVKYFKLHEFINSSGWRE